MEIALESRRKIYTVTELSREIRSLLESRYPAVWVEGEISGFKRHHSGHIYFSLKDEGAVLKAAFFYRLNQSLRFQMEDGLKVLCFGRISVYEPRGDYQLYVERVEPRGLGALQLALEQLKAKLAGEGLFDQARKRPIPLYPQKVGVVTSPTGAAIRDILNVMDRRFSGLHVLLYPVRVQGDGAAAEIARAIDELNSCNDIDVLIVGRGGGSLEDLWAFNEEEVARAIYRSRIPVISAVGHETDWTLADLVADLRAPTPSAAAELVTQSRKELEQKIHDLSLRIQNALNKLLGMKKELVAGLTSSYAFRQPLALVDQWSQRLDDLVRQLANYLKGLLAAKQGRFSGLAGKLAALSPLAVLARGYSLTFDEKGQLVGRADRLSPGELVRTRLAQGMFKSRVTEIENKE